MRPLLLGRRRQRNGAIALEERAESLVALAALLRLGLSPRRALMTWPDVAPANVREPLHRVARRVALGASPEAALAGLRASFEDDATSLAFVLDTARELGGRSAAMVETLAASTRERAGFASQSRAAGSGAVLSGRLIAGLPLAFVPLVPLARAPLFDSLGVITFTGGGALAALGILWIKRLMPVLPASDDPAAMLADVLAAVLAGGTHLDAALWALADRPPRALGTSLLKASRMVRLGGSWPEALAACGEPSLGSLGNALRRARSLGISIGPSLESWARSRRREIRHRFETATRRAGVLMMIPLTTCVLPAFILLGVVPFLRGLSLG